MRDLRQCRMRLCSLSTDARQDDLTPLWSDHLWGGKRGEIKKKRASITFPGDLVINTAPSLKVTLILSVTDYRSSLTWQNVGISVFLSVVLSARLLEGPEVVVTRQRL